MLWGNGLVAAGGDLYNVLTALKRLACADLCGLLKRLRFLIFYTAGRGVSRRDMRLCLGREAEGIVGWKSYNSCASNRMRTKVRELSMDL